MNFNKAIFLDRDGTLNRCIVTNSSNNFKSRPPRNIEELKVYDDITILNSFLKNFYLIIITNQPDINRGLQSHEFNDFINSEILKKINIKKIFTCYCHDSEKGCNCYKPAPGMILNAVKEFNIDIKHSYFIGDTWRDIELCKNTNLKSILIDRGYYKLMKNNFTLRKLKPDYIITSLLDIKKIIK